MYRVSCCSNSFGSLFGRVTVVTSGSSQSTFDSRKGLLCSACLTCLSLCFFDLPPSVFSCPLCFCPVGVILTVMRTLHVPSSCSQQLATRTSGRNRGRCLTRSTNVEAELQSIGLHGPPRYALQLTWNETQFTNDRLCPAHGSERARYRVSSTFRTVGKT